MKKKWEQDFCLWRGSRKLLLIMKLTFLLSIVLSLQATASGFAQVKKVSLNLKEASIEKVFSQVEKQSGYRFIYYSPDMMNHEKLDVKFEEAEIQQVVEGCLKDTDLTFEIVDNYVIIKKMPKKATQRRLVQPDNKIVVRGTVKDETGEPLPGATIIIKGTTQGVITDYDGAYFFVNVPSNAILECSFIGFADQEIEVAGKTQIDWVLKSAISELEDVMVVGFSKQKKESVVASITTVKPAELKVPASNLTTALAGKMSGVIAYQRSGEPGQDNAEFFIRGVTTFGYKKDPLILIDGIELTTDDLARLHPDDIESFSILKDATATSIYGARGANGVILVNTKEGVEGKATVNVRYEHSISRPTMDIDMADPITWMEAYNEAVKTRDALGVLPYSQSKIDATKAGINPYAYPAVDWRDALIEESTTSERFNINVNGGGKAVRYYLAANYSTDKGIFKEDPNNNYDSNINLNRLSLRSNTNIKLSNTTEAVLRFNGSFDDYVGPIHGGSTIFNMVQRANPVEYPMFYPNTDGVQHIKFGNTSEGNALNPYAEMVKGYKEYSQSTILAQVELKQDLSAITKGLNARLMANTTRYSYFDITRSTEPYYYFSPFYNASADNLNLVAVNEDDARNYLDYNEGATKLSTTFYAQAVLEYNREFREKHSIGGLLVGIMQNKLSNGNNSLQKSLPYRNMGLSGRFTYAYSGKYFTEFNFGYNGSERFSEKYRYGFFPSVGLGWSLHQENFWRGIENTISRFKLRASYGLVGNDAIGDENDRFFYLSQVNLDDGSRGATFGELLDYNGVGVSVNRYENDEISWEIGEKINLGIEMGLFDDDLEILADVFFENRSNILMSRSYIPPSMGLQNTVRANVGEAKSHGVDISANYSHSFTNGFWVQAMGNFTYATSEFVYFEEPDFGDATWRYRKGQPINQRWGYIAERLFVDENEVLNSPTQFGDYGAGDIKYRDVNNDGKINENDMVPIGYPSTPEIIYGFGFSTGYKNFDLSCFFQGSARSSFWIDPYASGPFIPYNKDLAGYSVTNGLLQVIADSHWSEENPDIYALWPRLSNGVVVNNTQSSTFYMQDGSFLRLKQLEFGYTLPQRFTEKVKIKECRIYFTGRNLMTWSKFKLWDPEMAGNGLGYPIQKVYNLGLQLNF